MKERCSSNTEILSLLNKRYRLILPTKFIINKSRIPLNHQVLKTKAFEVSVLKSFSIKVAMPIAAANNKKSTAVSLVEIIALVIFFKSFKVS
jgi:hypothetical protein